MNDFTQPFYINETMAKRMGRYDDWLAGKRYLPPLEPKSEPIEAPLVPERPWSKAQWEVVQQLKAQTLHLQNQIVELAQRKRETEKSKGKVGGYKGFETI